MSLRSIERLLGLALLAYSAFQVAVNPSWWAYVPVYALPAVLAIIQKPLNSTWRKLSSVSIVIGGIYTAFLLWTYSSVKSTPTLKLSEARNLPPLALGTLLISFIRLTQDKIAKPVHYLRTLIVSTILIFSFYTLITSFHYFI